jgi:hypothetical protein
MEPTSVAAKALLIFVAPTAAAEAAPFKTN